MEVNQRVELNDRLKKIKVLARAIYTESTARLMQYGPGKDFDLQEVAEDCIKSAMEFEGAFAIFEHKSIRDERLFIFEDETKNEK